MSIQIINPLELWKLSKDEFNRWREENDLPILFNYFSKKLPGFQEWLKKYNLDIAYLIKGV